MPYGRIGIYTMKQQGTDEVIEQARRELPPMMQKQPGFIRYSAARTGETEIVSLSAWETREQAEASGQTLVGWVRQHMGPTLKKADNYVGEIVLNEETSPEGSKYQRIALYKARPGQADHIVSQARQGFLPILRQQPGFLRYVIGKIDDTTLVSITGWQSKQQADAAVQKAAEWVKNKIADSIASVDNHVGEVLWSVHR